MKLPVSWTDNDLLYQRFDPAYKGVTVIKTTRSHSGKYALQFGVALNHDDTVNGGIYSTGSMDSLMHLLQHSAAAGFPCTEKYENFTGYYIFECVPGDTAVFGAVFTKWNWGKAKQGYYSQFCSPHGRHANRLRSFHCPVKIQD